MKDKGKQLLSDLVLYRTYSATKADGTKETYPEVVDRLLSQHKRKFPFYKTEIEQLREPLLAKRVLPSMRSLQFAGHAIEKQNVRSYNCSYTTIESFQDIAEIFFILMCGTGVGYSVRNRHISKLMSISRQKIDIPVLIPDTKEGWADSIAQLLSNYSTEFDYSLIRPAGAALSTGGTSSGPGPLKKAHGLVRAILEQAEGRQLTSLEVHDIVCIVADAVVVGGVRRAALISLFDADDQAMLTCKHGNWWETAPWRARANNSASINRADPKSKEKFEVVYNACIASNAGEPGIFWTTDDDWGGNPCLEISLQPKQMCNLSEVNVAACANFEELMEAIRAATTLGTLQAAYTDFSYLSYKWKENCEAEALLGVSMTGLAEKWLMVGSNSWKLQYFATYMKAVNESVARKIGIKPAARIGCVKPSGSASAFLGTTSGIHASHADYFIRRVRVDASHPITAHLQKYLSAEFFELDQFNTSNAVISIPMQSKGSISRNEETAIGLLERVKFISNNWIAASHRAGANQHNVSVTITYRPHEVEEVKEWMWNNKETYTGVSMLPHSDHVYVQAPFEEITKEKYEELIKKLPSIDLSKITYSVLSDERLGEAACAAGSCEFGVK